MRLRGARDKDLGRIGGWSGGEASYDEASRERFGTEGRMPVVLCALLVVVAVFSLRLAYIQIIKGPEYAERAANSRVRNRVLKARRGTIYDRNGNVLAMSEECYDIYFNHFQLSDETAEATLLAKHLGGNAADYKELLAQEQGFVYIRRQADKEVCEELSAELVEGNHTGIYFDEQIRRVYPYGKVGGQILGLVDVDGNGVSGLENAYNEQLAGRDGKSVVEMGLGEVPIVDAEAQVEEPVDGEDVVLSIDIDIQRYMEEQVEFAVKDNEATSGFAMACDPNTGEILAACSTPYADLTNPGKLQNEELGLKMVSSIYDPGSIFKVLTASIALESGKVDTSSYFTIPPYVVVGHDTVTDEDGRWEDMDMNLREMLRRSSNVAAALIAQEHIGADTFAKGLSSFGIGQLTGIDYPGEVEGMVKSREEYDGSSVGSMAFGQGLSIPMVQMVRAVGAIANGGYLRTPHFAVSVGDQKTSWDDGQRAISQRTAERVADMMCTVVEDGTATTAAVDGYEVAGKTGTGEQAEGGTYVQGKYLASLIGFAPARDPQVLLYVGLNETPYLAYSSAGPLFSAIMGEVLADMGVLSSSQGL